MADMGFMPQVTWLLDRITADHQTMLFSATLESEIDRLVRNYTHDPVRHEVESVQPTVEEMEHRFLKVHELDKVKVAAAIAKGSRRTLFFCRTKRGADRLEMQLAREGIKAGVLHGDLAQNARLRALKNFREDDLGVLVATDVAARGLDVDGIDVVVHYDPPEDHTAYLHRSGRTARAGATGVAVSLLLWDQQLENERLRRRLGIRQMVVEVFSNDIRLTDLLSAEWASMPDEATGTDGVDGTATATTATQARARTMRTLGRPPPPPLEPSGEQVTLGNALAPGTSPVAGQRQAGRSRRWLRRRSAMGSTALRSRTEWGVTSTHSSSAMNSRACSRESGRGGVRRTSSSDDDARMLVSFFSLTGLTSMSSDRELSPTIMPS